MPSLFWGFRLTIWNVNTALPAVVFKELISFRLTIWNVNPYTRHYNISTFLVLD
ncbi:hypothetical protein [Clostridioides difficile]|uniref:Mitochondrial division protein 1 n=2 Tax=root TaxID=1 RepID=A0A8S5PW36_9CAUD|nr:hypothetical protein [Clostridioides difficile]DAE10715.1 MAG TPA: Mitochondrial division protein 1 [Myoviridae sp. ct4QN2]ALP05117.1 hypothetical protein PCZ31_3218 [Clostridioides difficile]EJX3376104.1 hypothetical protein [Clostridioides difficile]EQG44137.1 hypothetical protein QIW_3122 [Clostridioides difficile DA00134]ERM45763.1 hypothetical protein C678_2397 [Clostridioides difficile F665]